MSICVISLNIACVQEKKTENDPDFPRLEAPFFGQKPPVLIPEIFAPRVVWTAQSEPATAFSPDVKEIYFRKYDEGLE